MSTHTVPVVRQWKHLVNAQSACRVTTPTTKGTLPLAFLPNGGNATFCTNNNLVHVETDGLFEIVPFDHAQLSADQKYDPDSSNAQSGMAVAEAVGAGELLNVHPAGLEPLAMQHGVWHVIDAGTTAVQIVAASDTSRARCMQLLLTPADDMQPGWLTAEGADIVWPYGEPSLVMGYAYAVTLVQVAVAGVSKIIANLTPLDAL